jgi:hypothetical protein
MIPASVVHEQHAHDVGEQEQQYERGDDVYGHLLVLPRFSRTDSGRSARAG